MTGPRVENVERSSQATPLAEEFLEMLRGQLSEGAFGTGVGPLQREAGTAIRQFLTSLQGKDGVSAGSQRLISGLETGSRARTERSVGDLRESQGILGTRFGTSLTSGEALLRTEAGSRLDQLIGGIQEQGRQFDQTQMLQAIAQLFGQGQANTGTTERFAALGVLPEEIIASPGFLDQLISGGLQAGASFLGRPEALPPGGPQPFPGPPSPGPTGIDPATGTPLPALQF